MTARRSVRSTRTALAAIMVAAAMLLSGCAGIPTSGPVREGPPIGGDPQDLIYRAIPQPPLPGATPDEIVRGFLAASSSGGDSYEVAREFLTRAAAADWQPLANVRIYDSTGVQTKVVGSAVHVTGLLDGTIDKDGSYQVAAGGQRLDVSYRMAKVEGEWRISGLPDGLVLGRGDVDREFRTYDLYFFDPSYSVLVPDPVTVPVVGSALPTTLVRALLRGPTEWLAPAVRTAFPEGTTLALDSVLVDSGVALVDLSTQVLSADDSTRAALSAQLVWTLRRLPGITGVRITAGGQPLSVPGAGPVQDVGMWAGRDADGVVGPDPALYGAAPTGLLTLGEDGELHPAPGGFGSGRPLVTSPAVALDGATLAAVGAADRRTLWVAPASGDGAARRVLSGAVDLSRPSWDRTGALWVVDRGGRGLEQVVDGTAAAVPIADLPRGSSGRSVVGVAVAPDGTRAALLLRRSGRVEVWLARVERDGSAVRLAAPRRVESTVADALDVAWAGVERLSILGLDGSGATRVFEVLPGVHSVQATTAPPSATGIAAAAAAAVVVTGGKQLFRQSGGAWTLLGRGTAPAYPG